MTNKIKYLSIAMLIVIILLCFVTPKLFISNYYSDYYMNDEFVQDPSVERFSHKFNEVKWVRFYINPQHPESLQKDELFFLSDSVLFINRSSMSFTAYNCVRHFLGYDKFSSSWNINLRKRQDSIYIWDKKLYNVGKKITLTENTLLIENFF